MLKTVEPPIIIFANTKSAIDELVKHINKTEWAAIGLHANKTQEHREHALTSFRSGDYDILVASNVAGRGIDIEGIQYVINYDMPSAIEDYKHRIGRTGRAGMTGVAITLITDKDQEVFYHLREVLLEAGARIPRELNHHEKALAPPGGFVKKKNPLLFAI